MSESGGAQRLADDLTALKEASGYSLGQIISLGEQQVPPVEFAQGSLSEWFNGEAVPSSKNRKFARLVELLEARAAQRQPGHRRRSPADWEQLRRRAQAGRRTRPGTAAAAPQTAVPEQRQVASGDIAKTARVLAALPPYAAWLETLRTKPMDWIHITVSTAFEEACKQLRREVADFIDPDLHEAYSALAGAAEALEHEMDGMHGPDPGSPWRVLKNYAPQRAEQLEKLTAARDLFEEKYRALINLLNQKDLLPRDAPTGPRPAAPPTPAMPPTDVARADDTNAIQALQGTLRDIVNSSPLSPLDLPERTGMSASEISRLMNGIGVTAPPWEDVARLLAAVGHDPADIHPRWAAAHRTAVFGPNPASGTAT